MSETTPSRRYAFGDSPTAAERLALVAELFDPTSRALLASLAARRPRDVVDLGCGPGHTTRLLAETLPTAEVVGIDQSAAFLDEARAAGIPRASFRAGDVRTALPDADLLYARFVLSHLPERQVVLAAWLAALRPGGVLVVEEPEAIETGDEVFARYLGITRGLMADRGGDLYVGGALPATLAALGARSPHDAVRIIDAPTAHVAIMFGHNLAVWRDDPWVVARHTASALDALADGLAARRDVPGADRIRWRLRQVVVARGALA